MFGRAKRKREFHEALDKAWQALAKQRTEVERLAKATLLFTDMRRLPEMLADQQSRPDRDTEPSLRPDTPSR